MYLPRSRGDTSSPRIDIAPTSPGSLTAQLANNQIDQIQQHDGIDAQASVDALVNLTLTSNTINMDSASSQDGVLVGSAGSVCLNSLGNTVVAAGTSSSDNAMEVDQLVFEIQGYSGASDASGVGAVETLLEGRDPGLSVTGAGSRAVATADGPNGFTGVPGPVGTTCPAPPPNGGDI